MEQLIKSTAAYKIFAGDVASDRLSHAYMLYFNDPYRLRHALKLFALRLFCAERGSRDANAILNENFIDLKIYPAPDKKLTVDDAGNIVDESVLRPVERDRKLFIVSGFESASPLFQNKLLKVLEEPPAGVCFLLGVNALAPVLDTVKSRVKLLEIPPFTPREIYAALERQGANPLNREAAECCAGVLGAAERMIGSDWYAEVNAAAKDVCRAKSFADAGEMAIRYGDVKYKNELLTEMQRQYFAALQNAALSQDTSGAILTKPALIYALENLSGAFADVKFNANFSALLYDFLIRVITENEKWKKL